MTSNFDNDPGNNRMICLPLLRPDPALTAPGNPCYCRNSWQQYQAPCLFFASSVLINPSIPAREISLLKVPR